MKLTFLGTCSGTEPVAGYHHCSFTVETDGGVYFFDAGEHCSYAAHVGGIDLLSVRAIFISHPHMDHVGGLPNLLWTMRKLAGLHRPQPHPLASRTVTVATPCRSSFDGMLRMLAETEGDFHIDWTIDHRDVIDGEVFDDGDLRVAAMHNLHMGEPSGGRPWRSFSYRIEAEGKRVVFSGDVRSIAELEPLAGAGCDLLLMETGHHVIPDICRYLAGARWPIGQVAFIHHGRATLADPDGQAAAGSDILGEPVIVLADGMTMEL